MAKRRPAGATGPAPEPDDILDEVSDPVGEAQAVEQLEQAEGISRPVQPVEVEGSLMPEQEVLDEEAPALEELYTFKEQDPAALLEQKVPEGMIRMVMPDYDRYHFRTPVGAIEKHWGKDFVKMPNGDMVGDISLSAAKAWQRARPVRAIPLSQHRPRRPASEQEILEAKRRSKQLSTIQRPR